MGISDFESNMIPAQASEPPSGATIRVLGDTSREGTVTGESGGQRSLGHAGPEA
jgi:hypothetical protein